MADIYDQHSAAFANVSAFVVLKDGERVATIAFKHSAASGRVTVYIHWIGLEMVRGFASGGGYDKHTAACSVAVRKIKPDPRFPELDRKGRAAFVAALSIDGGYDWTRVLADAGFTVFQAV